MINRYYDPTTDEFLSIDPQVAITKEPYVFTNDDPLNAEDPLGLSGPAWWRAVVDFPQDIAYATYWGSYEAIKGVNDLASGCGPVKIACSVINHLITAPLVPAEAMGLAGTAMADVAKGETIWQNGVEKQPLFGNQIGGVILSKKFDSIFHTKMAMHMDFPGFRQNGRINFAW